MVKGKHARRRRKPIQQEEELQFKEPPRFATEQELKILDKEFKEYLKKFPKKE